MKNFSEEFKELEAIKLPKGQQIKKTIYDSDHNIKYIITESKLQDLFFLNTYENGKINKIKQSKKPIFGKIS